MSYPAKNVRAYRRHLMLRLTYLEAEVLVRLTDRDDQHSNSQSESAAANRVLKKIREASEASPPEQYCFHCRTHGHDRRMCPKLRQWKPSGPQEWD